MAEPTESLSVKGSKGLIVLVISTLLAGGGLGASAVGLGTGRDATVAPLPYLSRAEIESVAAAKADRAEERALAAAKVESAHAEAAAREACNQEIAKLHRKLDKIDQIAEDIAALKAILPQATRKR